MKERTFPRLQGHVETTVLEWQRERQDDWEKREEEKRQLQRLIDDYEYLKSPPLVEALKAAGLVLRKASRSEILLLITQDPKPKDYSEEETFHQYPQDRLEKTIEIAMVWDIRDRDIRNRYLGHKEWNEISVSTRRDENGELVGLRFSSGEPFDTGLSEEEIVEAVDRAASFPQHNQNATHEDKYRSPYREEFQRIDHGSSGWVEPHTRR